MLPFLFGIGYFLSQLGKLILGEKNAPWLLLLCFADPVLASQSLLVSPDIVLCCFFLMAVWAIWTMKSVQLAIAVAFLGLISTRGMMLGLALYFFSIFSSNGKLGIKLFTEKLWPFLPGGLLAGAYLFYHWYETGWIGYHAGSTWAPSFERVDLQGFLKNIAVASWRMLDFGRIFVWLGIAWLGWALRKNGKLLLGKIDRQSTGSKLVFLTAIVFLLVVPTQLLYKGLLAHRYFLPFFLSLNLTFLYLLLKTAEPTKPSFPKKILAGITCIGLATGNLWTYPDKIATGWDSTLAHLPWHGLVDGAIVHLKAQGIPLNKVGTAFPNIGSRELYDLNGGTDGFVKKDLKENCYVLYSNVMNDFRDEEIDELRTWPILYGKQVGAVKIILYKNPNISSCAN